MFVSTVLNALRIHVYLPEISNMLDDKSCKKTNLQHIYLAILIINDEETAKISNLHSEIQYVPFVSTGGENTRLVFAIGG